MSGENVRTPFSPSSAQRSRAGGAGRLIALEEPTAEMIEAGLSVLWASGAIEGQLDSDELLVAEIFQAMAKAIPSSEG
jgi:hypothetical protein